MDKQVTADHQQADEWTVRLCRALRETLGAERVSVWLYEASGQTVSPYASDAPDDPELEALFESWAHIPLENFPAACTALLEARPVDVRDAHNDERLPPELAADFGLRSVHYEPLVVGRPVGMLSIEPAGAARNPELYTLVPIVAASLSRALGRWESDRARAEAEFLLELAQVALGAESLDEMLATVCERIARQLEVRRVSVFLLDEGALTPRMAWCAEGSDSGALEDFRRASAPLPAVEAAMHSGEPVLVDDPSSPLVSGWWTETFGIVSGLAAPLGQPPAHIGVLALDDTEPHRFSKEDARFVTAVGAHVGAMIERARATEERSSHLKTATAIRELLEQGSRASTAEEAGEALARVAREALDTDHATVILFQNEEIAHVAVVGDAPQLESELRERLVGEPAQGFRLFGAAGHQPRPTFVENAEASRLIPSDIVEALDLRSYAALPLLSGNEPIGLVICGVSSEVRRWTAEDEELAAQLALEGSLVVENAAFRAAEHEQIGVLSRQAFHDSLTELPNRALFADRLEHALARMNRREGSIAVLFLDLDEFKEINDRLGHQAGDQLLTAVAQRLRGCLRPEDTVARLGGDEFTILLEDISDTRYAIRVAERIAESLATPFTLDGHRVSVTTSIGIAVSTGREEKPSELLRNSDLAMYRAKDNGRGRHEIFTPDMYPSAAPEDEREAEEPPEPPPPPSGAPAPAVTEAHPRRRMRFPRR